MTGQPDSVGQSLVVVEAGARGEPLPAFVIGHLNQLDAMLHRHGALLFRGFEIDTVERFQRVCEAVFRSPARYVEGATPRRSLGGDVYTSTEFPASEKIALHNENSYAASWPGRLLFACMEPPETGGATPVADVRRVLRRLTPATRAQFDTQGWRLVRNYGSGFGLQWQTAFGTDRKENVARYCRGADVEFEWLDDDRLRTWQTRPACVCHPVTKDVTWFNHVHFWHVSMLDEESRELLLEAFGEEGLPFNTYYGDGRAIPEEIVAEIADAYRAEEESLPWQRGDVLLIDNVLAAHGREPYSGNRQVVVAMGDPLCREDCLV